TVTQAAERDFSIPAQSLTSALVSFGQQSGAQITSDGGMVNNLSSPGVRGRMAPAQALQQLLAGTGLTYAITSGGTFTLHQAAAQTSSEPNAIELGPVRVEGQNAAVPRADPYADPEAPYKVDRLSSSKFTEPVVNTPRSVTVLTKEVLEDKNATT